MRRHAPHRGSTTSSPSPTAARMSRTTAEGYATAAMQDDTDTADLTTPSPAPSRSGARRNGSGLAHPETNLTVLFILAISVPGTETFSPTSQLKALAACSLSFSSPVTVAS